MNEIARVVQLVHCDRTFTFTIDEEPPLKFWRVTVDGADFRIPLRATGDEEPGFFRSAANFALEYRDRFL